MNRDISFVLQTLHPITRVLFAITLIDFNYSAFATDVVTDDQIRRVAKIARATKTDITITKERVTVTVHGDRGKKAARKVKKSVSRIMKQKNYVQKQSFSSEDSSDFASTAPALNNSDFRPPPTINNTSHRPPPVLNTPPGSSSQPPALDRSGSEDSDYY